MKNLIKILSIVVVLFVANFGTVTANTLQVKSGDTVDIESLTADTILVSNDDFIIISCKRKAKDNSLIICHKIDQKNSNIQTIIQYMTLGICVCVLIVALIVLIFPRRVRGIRRDCQNIGGCIHKIKNSADF